MNRFVCLSISPACFTVAFHWPHSPFLFSSALATKSKNEPLKRYSLVLVNWPLWHNQFLMWSPCSELCLESTLASWAIIKVHLTERQIIDFFKKNSLHTMASLGINCPFQLRTDILWYKMQKVKHPLIELWRNLSTLFCMPQWEPCSPLRIQFDVTDFENVWPFRYSSSHRHVKMSKLKMIIFS